MQRFFVISSDSDAAPSGTSTGRLASTASDRTDARVSSNHVCLHRRRRGSARRRRAQEALRRGQVPPRRRPRASRRPRVGARLLGQGLRARARPGALRPHRHLPHRRPLRRQDQDPPRVLLRVRPRPRARDRRGPMAPEARLHPADHRGAPALRRRQRLPRKVPRRLLPRGRRRGQEGGAHHQPRRQGGRVRHQGRARPASRAQVHHGVSRTSRAPPKTSTTSPTPSCSAQASTSSCRSWTRSSTSSLARPPRRRRRP